MKYSIPIAIISALHITTKYISALLLFIIASSLYSMEAPCPIPQDSVLSYSLPRDIIIKIVACADLETKKNLRLTCSELCFFDIKDLLKHSPLILNRKDHLYLMVQTTIKNDQEAFTNLLCNAVYCDHADVLDIVPYFLPKDSHELTLLQTYFTHPDNKVLGLLLPYIMAVYKGDKETIDQYLIKNMNHPEHKNVVNPLCIAIHHKHPNAIGELLLTQHVTLLNSTDPDDNTTPLFVAALVNNVEMCKFLLSFKEIAANIASSDSVTPLTIAVNGGYSDIVNVLISHTIDSDYGQKDQHGNPIPCLRAPWYRAIWLGHMDIAKTLLTLLDFQVPYATKPLHVAIMNNQPEMVKMLLEHSNTDVNAQDENGRTALFLAADLNNVPLAQLLLDNKANVNTFNHQDQTPLWCASFGGYIDMLTLLLKYNARIDTSKDDDYNVSPLSTAIQRDHTPIIRILIEQGIDPNIRFKQTDNNMQVNSATPLLLVTDKNNYEGVEFLLQHGAQVDAIDQPNGLTSLMLAAAKDYRDILQLLLAYDAQVDAIVPNGLTALSMAAQEGHLDILQLLLKNEAHINHQDNDGFTALHHAVLGNHISSARFLLDNGAKVDLLENQKKTPLWCASRKGYADIVELLLAYKADIDIPMEDNCTPLCIATCIGHMPIIRMLIEHGANPNTGICTETGEFTPLMLAIENNNYEAIELLLKSGAQVNGMSSDGWTPLMLATQGGDLNILQLLLQHGAQIDTMSPDGWSSLMIAARKGHLDALQLLLKNGADINHQASQQETTLSVALTNKQKSMITFLLEQPNLLISEKERDLILDGALEEVTDENM